VILFIVSTHFSLFQHAPVSSIAKAIASHLCEHPASEISKCIVPDLIPSPTMRLFILEGRSEGPPQVYNLLIVCPKVNAVFLNLSTTMPSFSCRLVLASPETATDLDYSRIEGVVGHEYFQ